MRSEPPRAKLEVLAFLVGKWSLRGRSVGATEDNISGSSETTWSGDHEFLDQRSSIRVGTEEVRAIEIIGYRPDSDEFPAWVFTGGAPEPLRYTWRVEGAVVTHEGLGATFRGSVSPDRRTIRGAWRSGGPTPDPSSDYSVEMVRID
jgi:hypothetical protein